MNIISIDKTDKCRSPGCKRKARFFMIDLKLDKQALACLLHFEQGVKAWLQKDPIVKHLMQEGLL